MNDKAVIVVVLELLVAEFLLEQGGGEDDGDGCELHRGKSVAEEQHGQRDGDEFADGGGLGDGEGAVLALHLVDEDVACSHRDAEAA